MEDATFLEARAGLRPATSDGLPIIGPSPASDRIVYATGHYRNGILLAPLTATLVADRDRRPRGSDARHAQPGAAVDAVGAIGTAGYGGRELWRGVFRLRPGFGGPP